MTTRSSSLRSESWPVLEPHRVSDPADGREGDEEILKVSSRARTIMGG